MSNSSVLSVDLQPSKRLFWILVALHIGASLPIAMTLGSVGCLLVCPVLIASFGWQWKRVNSIQSVVLDRDLGARLTLVGGTSIRAELMNNWTHSSRLILLNFKVEPQEFGQKSHRGLFSKLRGQAAGIRKLPLRHSYSLLILPDSLNPGDFHAILSTINISL